MATGVSMTQTFVAEDLFRKFGNYPCIDKLDTHNMSKDKPSDNLDDKNDQLNGNRIRVLKRNVIIVNYPLAKKFEFAAPVVSTVDGPKPSVADKSNCVDFDRRNKNDNKIFEFDKTLIKENTNSVSKYKHHNTNAVDKCSASLKFDRSKPKGVSLPETVWTDLNPNKRTSISDIRTNVEDKCEKENIVEGLDIDEGYRIWNEVDRIIRTSNSTYRRHSTISDTCRYSYNNGYGSEMFDHGGHNKSLERFRYSLNCIEFSRRFNKTKPIRSWRHLNRIWSYEGINSDNETTRNNGTGKSAEIDSTKVRKISNVFPSTGEIDTRVVDKRWTGLVNNIWSTFDVSTGTKDDIYRNSYRHHLDTRWECKDSKAAMTTTLPRLTPASTPLPTGITQPPPRSHSSASMYVPYPPKELSSSFDFVRIPGRINPLAPPPPKRRINWSWETTNQHHENEKRRLLMQKREHTRYHSAWSKAFYGAPAEKEAYRRHFREVLKQQMSDKQVMEKEDFKQKIKETEQAIVYDSNCRKNDAQEYYRKHTYLMQYRDGNKQQMEDRWAQNRNNRELENRVDRERLRYNPINWSCTLK